MTIKNNMRSAKELVEFCKERTSNLGMTQAQMLEKAGCDKMTFVMMLRRNSYPKIETLVALSNALEVSISDILGLNNDNLPDDIQKMVSMLKDISPENRKMILMNIENYFTVEKQKKM